jgi:hypothetical protein
VLFATVPRHRIAVLHLVLVENQLIASHAVKTSAARIALMRQLQFGGFSGDIRLDASFDRDNSTLDIVVENFRWVLSARPPFTNPDTMLPQAHCKEWV